VRKVIFHFDVHDVYSWGAGSLANHYAVAPHHWGEEVVGHDDVHSIHRIWYAEGGERSVRATIDPRAHELRSRPASGCAFPLIEGEELIRREDLGLWVRLVPVGWRVSWYNEGELTANK